MKHQGWALGAVLFVVCASAHAQGIPELHAAKVEDAIRMTRIQHNVAADGSVAALSPDGRKAAAVLWRGDLERNVNVYTLVTLDLSPAHRGTEIERPEEVLSRDFTGDPDYLQASPFSKLVFLSDNRTIAYLGRDEQDVAQVFTVDTATKQVTQRTHHPTPVRSFSVGPDGRIRAFSAAASAGTAQMKARLQGDGVFMWDRELFPLRMALFSAQPMLWYRADRPVREYFRAGAEGPVKFFDSRRNRPAAAADLLDPRVATSGLSSSFEDDPVLESFERLSADPTGKSVLLFPYSLTDHPMHPERYAYYQGRGNDPYLLRLAAPFAVVDVASGRITRLVDAPGRSVPPVWAPDGTSVIVATLLPDAPQAPFTWVEVSLDAQKVVPLGLPAGWDPIGWTQDGHGLLLRGSDARVGVLPRDSSGRWQKLAVLGAIPDANKDWTIATDGKVAIGVEDSTLTAPELVVYAVHGKRVLAKTDLNPQLRSIRYADVEVIHWATPRTPDLSGFLVKPLGYKPGIRYPLVILQDDGTLGRSGTPYLLDASVQLSGYAIQSLAAQGIMVLYTRESPVLGAAIQTPEEGVIVREQMEAVVAMLDEQGLVDRNRIGISGWSRAGYHTNYLLIHSSIPFAAASTIDGGSTEYTDRMRAFSDEELRHIHAPLLFESHSLSDLVWSGSMADRLMSMNRPTEILFFSAAPHSTLRPQHRLRSLTTHLDWWRFWLQGYEDASPEKEEQYAHWRKYREVQGRSRGD
ncbi:MAG: hypothetical protein WDO68_30910 [Gammaproteobacteria bacterium]